MVKENSLFFGFMLAIALLTKHTCVLAITCETGMEPVLKIEYQAEDHMYCKDPRSLELPSTTPWGINKSIIYRTNKKHKRVDLGQCVTPDGTNNGLLKYRNLQHKHIWIDSLNKSYSIDVVRGSGSVQYSVSNPVGEVGPYAYTKEEYLSFKKMHVLPGYDCRIIPPFAHDPSKMSVCVTEINNMRIVLYRQFTEILSKHINWYKAKSVKWVCGGANTFEPPEGVNIHVYNM